MPFQQRMRGLGQRIASQGSTESPHRATSVSISASRVSSSQLKEYLDSRYPGQYSVKVCEEFPIIVLSLHPFMIGSNNHGEAETGRIYDYNNGRRKGKPCGCMIMPPLSIHTWRLFN
ncbi:hypothetical protein F5Y13DRAFT_91278 [Hypoxylon sp. FL1857]|nr:hypothetical protein F5Y13DRAFT_91278 [Hypoxylon sp. FL1857]